MSTLPEIEADPAGPEHCQRCGCQGLYLRRSLGQVQLHEYRGGLHRCPDILEANRLANDEQVRIGKKLSGSRRGFDTTGNIIPRWVWRGGETGDVEPY